MQIHETQFIRANAAEALNAAERWLHKEAPDLAPHRGLTSGGREYVGIEQVIDGIEITTRFVAEAVENGSVLSFHLRMRGTSFLGKIRNLGMLPAKKHVRHASREQFQQIIDELHSPIGE